MVCAAVLPKNGHVGCAGILAVIDQRIKSSFPTVQNLVYSDAGAVLNSFFSKFSFQSLIISKFQVPPGTRIGNFSVVGCAIDCALSTIRSRLCPGTLRPADDTSAPWSGRNAAELLEGKKKIAHSGSTLCVSVIHATAKTSTIIRARHDNNFIQSLIEQTSNTTILFLSLFEATQPYQETIAA